MKKYTTNAPAFSPEIILPEVTDPGHADIINPAPIQLLQNTLCNKRSIENLQKNMGAVETGGYSTEIKYHVGEYCMYNNILYKCMGDTQGEWNPECWVQTNPIEEIKGLQKSIGSLAKLFRTDDEGNMKPLGAAAYAGISKNFDTLEDGFVPDAMLMKLLKDQVDEQNSALFSFLESIKILENTDISTVTYNVPDGYSGFLISLMTGNCDASYVYLDEYCTGADPSIYNHTVKTVETLSIRFSPDTGIITFTLTNKSAYQKQYGNRINIWGVR